MAEKVLHLRLAGKSLRVDETDLEECIKHNSPKKPEKPKENFSSAIENLQKAIEENQKEIQELSKEYNFHKIKGDIAKMNKAKEESKKYKRTNRELRKQISVLRKSQ